MLFFKKASLRSLALLVFTVSLLTLLIWRLFIYGDQELEPQQTKTRPLEWVTKPASKYSWQALGPGGGGHFDVFAFSPGHIFVGTDTGGVLRSPDHGESWLPINQGLYDYPINDLAVAPDNPAIIYAATHGGVYRSTNSGDVWELLTNGFPPKDKKSYSAPIASIAIDPMHPDTIYVGTGRILKWRATDGTGDVYKSIDSGQNWTRYNLGSNSAVIYAIAVDPKDTKLIYAATDEGFYRSSDAGQNWTQIDNLETKGLVVGYDEVERETILYRTVWGYGVYRSDDGGISWHQLISLDCPKCDYYRIVIEPTDPTASTVYVGDYGRYEGRNYGVYKTTDGGNSWTPMNKFGESGWFGSPIRLVRGLGVNPYQSTELFFAGVMVMYRRNDHQNWEQVFTYQQDNAGGADGQWPGRWISRLGNNNTVINTRPIFHPTHHNEYAVGYSDLYIWRTNDNGRSWENIETRGDNDIRSLAADPNDAEFQTWFVGDSPQSCCEGALYKTSDGGQNWFRATGLPNNRVWDIEVIPGNSESVYVVTQDHGVYWSIDGGRSFKSKNGNGADSLPIETSGRFYHLVIDKTDPESLYVSLSGESGGIYKSGDGGEQQGSGSDQDNQ